MKKILFILLFQCVFFLSAQATHIVGGELGFKHVNNNQYNLNLTVYFDAINGTLGAIDPNVTLHIFRKSNNTLMESVTLPHRREEFVNYINPECAIDSLSTLRLYYEIEVEMLTSEYNDQEGYYMIWERCCRNNIISNITSPEDAGQTFYLEFPPLTISNSSPIFSPILNDYACVNQDFTFNFGGTDPDNDELKYSLKTPINGFSSSNQPVPPTANSAPYPLVNFITGVGVDTMIPGNPSLRINQDGVLNVRPFKAGLYVFAIACEEFRNGVKIGEVRREFQLQVLDCPNTNPPLVSTNLEFDPTEGIYIGSVRVNDEIRFDTIGKDINNESVSIDAKGIEVDLIDLGFDFLPITGESPQFMPISWTPTCEFLGENEMKSIELEVHVNGTSFCNNPSFETVKIKITVRDYVSTKDFLPVNVFTPNSDGKNDTFAIPSLPIDGCRDFFKNITIFNRWGKEVFQSENRNFEWTGDEFPSGVYFYVINYISFDLSGNVSLIRSK